MRALASGSSREAAAHTAVVAAAQPAPATATVAANHTIANTDQVTTAAPKRQRRAKAMHTLITWTKPSTTKPSSGPAQTRGSAKTPASNADGTPSIDEEIDELLREI